MIREARGGDRDAIAALARQAHGLSGERGIKIQESKGQLALARFIALKTALVLVDEDAEGWIRGFLIGATDTHWYSDERYAISLLVFAERPGAGRAMVRRFVKWALEEVGASQVILDTSFGGEFGERAERVYERIGLRRVGATFIARRET